jgi:uncharacterized membrane protein
MDLPTLSGRFTDIGIDDNFMKEAAGTLTPGQAALCVLVAQGHSR